MFVMSRPVDPPNDLLARSISHADLPDPGRSLALLALAQAGDRGALEELVTRYQERLRRIVRIQLGASAVDGAAFTTPLPCGPDTINSR
jgi:hypothetical protein